jgi:hypothetical protein
MSQTKKSILAFILLSTLCTSDAFVPTTRSIHTINHHSKCRNQHKLDSIEHVLNLGAGASTSNGNSRTRMNMSAAAPVGAAAAMGVISGGILGGALHAIAGKFKKHLRRYRNDYHYHTCKHPDRRLINQKEGCTIVHSFMPW